jgi:hypothetical protein
MKLLDIVWYCLGYRRRKPVKIYHVDKDVFQSTSTLLDCNYNIR